MRQAVFLAPSVKLACKERGKKTVLFPLAEEAAVLCKGPPGKGIGECTARRARTIPWLQPGKKTVLFPLAEEGTILCKGPPGEGIGECTARRARTIPLVAAGQKNSFLSACGRDCCPVLGPARRGRRGMHSPQGEHNSPCYSGVPELSTQKSQQGKS